MCGSEVVIEVYSAVFGTYRLYSKIVSKLALVLLLNTYKRFQSVSSPYSTTLGTRLCVPSTSEIKIPRTQKEEPH